MHKLERQKVICPLAEDCKVHDENDAPCPHGIEHLEDESCVKFENICPECIKTQEVVDEETFSEEDFEL